MKYLFKNTVIGFLLMSSLPAFSQETPPEVIGESSTEQGSPSPPGGGGYKSEELGLEVRTWKGHLSSSCMYTKTEALKIYGEIEKASDKYQESQVSCDSREDKTNSVCRESRNSGIKDFISVAQVLMAGVSGMTDACNGFGKVMDLGNKALTAYQTGCSTARGFCTSSCSDAVNSIKKIKGKRDDLAKEVAARAKERGLAAQSNKDGGKEAAECTRLANSIKGELETNHELIDRELKKDKDDYRPVAQKLATCEGYAKELATAALGTVAMLKSFATANKCEQNTSSSPTVASATPVDCTIAANKQNNMECICKDAPRTPGCNNGLDTATVAKSADSLRAASGTGEYNPAAAGGAGGIDGGSDMPDMAKKADGGGGGSLPGAPSGGGSGLGGSSGGFGGGPGGGGAQKGSGLNTNILAGEGGGGGGGSWGGFGGSDKDGLRQYLPGGKRDPSGAMAGAAVSKEVTSQGGKSNWEKVRDRYRDNKPSLLGY